MIGTSNAAFNHQSMSFKDPAALVAHDILGCFANEAQHVLAGARSQPMRVPEIIEGDARTLEGPYMYWLGFLADAREAGELDWRAIGGTWGIATSRVSMWESPSSMPLNGDFSSALKAIVKANPKSGVTLSRYVAKYFHDVWDHVQAAYRVMAPQGSGVYIVGNSTFSKVHVPTHEWYAALLTEAGFERATIEVIRKRNSNKALFEYAVRATKPAG